MRSPCLVSKSNLSIKYHKSQFYSSLKDLKLNNEGAQEQESGPEGPRGAEQRRLLGLSLVVPLNCVAEDLNGDAALDCVGRGELFAVPGGLALGERWGTSPPAGGASAPGKGGLSPAWLGCCRTEEHDACRLCLFFWISYVWLFCKCDLGTCFLGRCFVTC